MSHRAMDWALEQDCPAIARLILVKLASYANEQGECWPSLTRLARDLQLGRTTLKRQIKALVASGLLKSQPRLNGSGLGSNLFTMNPEARADPRSRADRGVGPERTDPRSGADPKPVIEEERKDSPSLYVPPSPGGTPDEDAPAPNPDDPVLEVKPHGRPKARGTTLSEDWQPDDRDCDYALVKGLDPLAVAEKFRNHWIAKAGKDATKRDWHAAWRNWCLNTIEFAARDRSRNHHPEPVSEIGIAARALAHYADRRRA